MAPSETVSKIEIIYELFDTKALTNPRINSAITVAIIEVINKDKNEFVFIRI